ncbi:hypothetical protein CYMTET_49674 [Cymbomonas tetramitiformis]|uniref:EF-hand domain-containing protein n=1 Tax=Cymbomonas tetramitiformis TaxID=36881 RepID=A0AAE0EUG8_9CHLO|nr:hypothetical protein CYMTET_49674 [Cymbomonas tetramitiformis]
MKYAMRRTRCLDPGSTAALSPLRRAAHAQSLTSALLPSTLRHTCTGHGSPRKGGRKWCVIRGAPKPRSRGSRRPSHLSASAGDAESEASLYSEAYLEDDTFLLFDRDGDGYISVHDLRAVMCSLGQNPSLEYCEEIINGADLDSDGKIDRSEFYNLMDRGLTDIEESTREVLRNCFEEICADGTCSMEAMELRDCLIEQGYAERTIDELFEMQDCESEDDGEYDFQGFEQLMKLLAAAPCGVPDNALLPGPNSLLSDPKKDSLADYRRNSPGFGAYVANQLCDKAGYEVWSWIANATDKYLHANRMAYAGAYDELRRIAATLGSVVPPEQSEQIEEDLIAFVDECIFLRLSQGWERPDKLLQENQRTVYVGGESDRQDASTSFRGSDDNSIRMLRTLAASDTFAAKLRSGVVEYLSPQREFVTLREKMKKLGRVAYRCRDCGSTNGEVPVWEDNKSGETRQPVLLLLGGGMGAGKSTVASMVMKKPFWAECGPNAVIVEADAFKHVDVVFQALSDIDPTDHSASTRVHDFSTQTAASLFVSAVNEGRDIIFDGTMAWYEFFHQTVAMVRDHKRKYRVGPGYVRQEDGSVLERYWEPIEEDPKQATKEQAPRAGVPYVIEMVGATCDPVQAVTRGLQRMLLTGRGVPVSAQLSSHQLFSQAFPKYVEMVDHAWLYDTGAGNARVIAHKEEGCTLLKDDQAYGAFMRKAAINDQATGRHNIYQCCSGGSADTKDVEGLEEGCLICEDEDAEFVTPEGDLPENQAFSQQRLRNLQDAFHKLSLARASLVMARRAHAGGQDCFFTASSWWTSAAALGTIKELVDYGSEHLERRAGYQSDVGIGNALLSPRQATATMNGVQLSGADSSVGILTALAGDAAVIAVVPSSVGILTALAGDAAVIAVVPSGVGILTALAGDAAVIAVVPSSVGILTALAGDAAVIGVVPSSVGILTALAGDAAVIAVVPSGVGILTALAGDAAVIAVVPSSVGILTALAGDAAVIGVVPSAPSITRPAQLTSEVTVGCCSILKRFFNSSLCISRAEARCPTVAVVAVTSFLASFSLPSRWRQAL